MTDDLQNRDNQIQAIQYENVTLQAERDIYQAELEKCQDTITCLRASYVDHARNPETLSSLYGNIKRLSMIDTLICHIILRGYNSLKGILS